MKRVIIHFLPLLVVIFSSLKVSSQVRPASCNPTFNSHNACCAVGIERVKYGSLDNTTGNPTTGDPIYHDFTTTDTAIIYMNQTDSIIIENPFTNKENVYVYIDWNDDGDFLDVDEQAFVSLNDTYHDGTITPPTHALMNTLVRMRVMSEFIGNTINGPCDNIAYGQAEDYALLLLPEPFKVQSIVRNNPTAASTTSNNMQFKVNFNKDAVAVDSSDFVLNGSAASNTGIQSVSRINGSQYLVNVATTHPTSGTLGLDLKGVDASGTNNIIEDNGVLDQYASADQQVTNSPEFGQSFVAGGSGLLTKIILRTGFGHSFTGNGVLEVYSGSGFGGSLISTSTVYFPSSPLFTDIIFYLENPAQLSAGLTYTFRFNFPTASSSNLAVAAQTGNPYANGVLYQPGALSVADLYFKTFVTPSIKSLSSTLPATDESYDFLVPLQVSTTVDSNQTNLITPNGGATVSYSGGVPPYLVQWSHGANIATVTDLSSGKYYVTVTDNNGSSASLTQTVVDSVEIEGVNPFKLSSIRRNNPMDSITSQSNLQFKLNFSEKAGNYMLSDFMAIGGLADSLTLNSVVYETDSSCLIDATLNSSVDGAIGIGIKGVGGLPGSNGIYTFSIVDTLSVNHLTTDDYLNQAVIGQTYTAIKGNLKQVVIFPKSGNHTFNGTVDLKVYSGDYSTGSQTLLHSESVNLSNSTAATGQTFELSNLVTTTPRNIYTITFENFSGSGSHAFESAISGNYSGGHVVFTNYNPSNHSGFDLKIKITEAFEDVGGDLDTLAPNLNQSYQYIAPVLLESIQRYLPLDSVTSQSNLQFKLMFNQAIANLSAADLELTGQLADSASVNGLSALNSKEHLVDVALNSSIDGSIGLGVKGVGNISGSNGIKGVSIVDTLTLDQSFTDDYLDHAVIGQTYMAIKENLKQVVIFPESVNHSFSGTADLKVYSGDYNAGSPTLIHSESVNITSNTSASGQAFELSTLVATIPGNTYSITFENFNGSGSHALESAIVGTYPNGHVIFSNYSSGSHSDFDLKIKIMEASQILNKDLDTLSPSLVQSYQYSNPCQPTSSVQIANACNTYNWSLNGMNYTETGMYHDTIPNAAGCDSVITLDLTINNTVRDTNSVTACDSYVWSSNGLTYTTSGIYSDTLAAANGCDSISSIDLTLSISTSSMQVMTSCNSYLWSQNNVTYIASGMYKDTIPNAVGCDSVITLDLTINHTVRDTNAVTACDNYVWASTGLTYTNNGIYSDTLMASNGCDSISSIDLTLSISTSSMQVMTSCNSYLWSQNNVTYIASGMYNDTIPNAAGCDSVITLDLTINHTVRDTNAVTACDSYVWASNGLTYTTSGIYSDTLTAANGCDSISSIDLTLNLSTSTTLSVTSCDSYLWSQNNMTYTTSGMYNDTIPNAAGCDSVITLDLTINNTVRDTSVVTACDGYVWASTGLTYTNSGIYSDTLMASNGCDSIASIDLTLIISTSSMQVMTSCDSYLWSQNNMIYTATGMYNDTIPNAVGCDSVITLDLTINHTVRDTNAVTACDSYVWASNGLTYTTSGIYSDTLIAANGCDSISSIDLMLSISTSSMQVMTSCDSYLWSQNNVTYTATGMYNDTIPNAAGCDSVIILDLTINNTVRDTNAVTACDSYVWASTGLTYTTSGIYSDTLTAANGCDSISSIDLTLNLSTSTTLSVTSCNSYLWSQNNMTYTTSGMYNDTIPNAASCDSVITLDLTINNTVRDTNAVTACDSYVWASNGLTYATSGIYSDTLIAANGCDSISSIDLTINMSTSSSLNMTSCDSYLWSQNNMTYTTSGMYNDTIPNAAGCDSVITLDLTINNTVRDTSVVTACDGYVWASTGLTYTNSGIYSDTLMAANGCDSIASIDLTIDTVDTRVIRNGFDLIAQLSDPNATIQWIDCSVDTAITSATSSIFTVTRNGSYSLEVSLNNCVDTSACISVLNVGLTNIPKKESWFNLYPNPTKHWVNVEVSEIEKTERIFIYNIEGSLVREVVPKSKLSKVELTNLASGIYFVRYKTETKKLIIRD